MGLTDIGGRCERRRCADRFAIDVSVGSLGPFRAVLADDAVALICCAARKGQA